MQFTYEEVRKKSTMTIFKCHFIIAFVTLLLIGFMSSNFWALMGFYTFITVSYVFLLYSESLMAARRDFYNENGVMEKVDLKFGFKIGFRAHIFSLILLGLGIVVYCVCVCIDRVDFLIYVDNTLKIWMFHFMGFFPNTPKNVTDWTHLYQWTVFGLYFLFSFFPCLVCGISYYLGIRQCKTKNS